MKNERLNKSRFKSFLRDLGNDLRKDLNLNINLMRKFRKNVIMTILERQP